MIDISDNMLCALIVVCATVILAISAWRQR